MSVAGSQTGIVEFDNDSLEGSNIEIGDDDSTIDLAQGAAKERRGRGRPPTTWEHVGKKEKEEEKARLKEEEKERLAAESLKPTAPKGRKWSQLLDQEELEARLNETPTEDIASRLMERSVTAFNIAKCPNSLKGSLVKELQEMAVLMRAATNVMATRVRKAQEGKMERLLKKVEELQAENVRLKGEMEQVKTRLPPPTTSTSAPTDRRKRSVKRRRMVDSSSDLEEDRGRSPIHPLVPPHLRWTRETSLPSPRGEDRRATRGRKHSPAKMRRPILQPTSP